MIDSVIVYSTSDIMGLFSEGMIAGLFFGSFCFVIGYVINFLLSLIGDRVN